VILAALFVINRSASSWQHYIVSADPGTLIYAATFDVGNGDDFNGDWSQYEGRLSAQIDGEQMRITVGDFESGAYSVAAPHFGDFDLRAQGQTLDGPIDNGYGVVFRLQNKDNNSVDDDSYYVFLISADGWYRVGRVIDGDEKILSDWNRSPFVKQDLNTFNELRVVARGNQFWFYINDEPVQVCIPNDPDGQSTFDPRTGECLGTMVDALTDDAIPNGQIGVTAQSTASGGEGVVVGFDNVLVYSPE
jgi:hypothetical protein